MLEHIENECVCVIADGAAIGPEMDRLYKCALKKKIILTAEIFYKCVNRENERFLS